MRRPLTDDLVRAIERTRAAYRFVRLDALLAAGLTLDEGTFRTAGIGSALATDWAPMPRVFCFDHTQLGRLDDILAWYAETGRSPHFELLPFDGNRAVFAALAARGFAPRYTISVLLHEGAVRPVAHAHAIRLSPPGEIESWCGTYVDAHGWECTPDERPKWIAELSAQYLAAGIARYVVECEGEVAGVAASYRDAGGDHAHLTNCATLPSYRGRGLHVALIAHRLRDLDRAGAVHVAADTTPYSVSHRNLERAGLRIAYQKTHWEA